jgi:hypothetical protein
MSTDIEYVPRELSPTDREILELMDQLNRQYDRYLDATSIELGKLVELQTKPSWIETTTSNTLTLRTSPHAFLERSAQ